MPLKVTTTLKQNSKNQAKLKPFKPTYIRGISKPCQIYMMEYFCVFQVFAKKRELYSQKHSVADL